MYNNPIYKKPLLSPEKIKQQALLKEQNEKINNQNNSEETIKSSYNFFERLQLLIEYLGYKGSIIRPDINNPVEKIILEINSTSNLEINLEIFFITDFLKDDSEEGLINLQLLSNLPVVIPEKKFVEVAVILARVTPFISIGHLGITPENNLYYLHSITGTGKRSIDLPSLVYIFEIIENYLPFITSLIKLFIEDKINIEQCINEFFKKLGIN